MLARPDPVRGQAPFDEPVGPFRAARNFDGDGGPIPFDRLDERNHGGREPRHNALEKNRDVPLDLAVILNIQFRLEIARADTDGPAV